MKLHINENYSIPVCGRVYPLLLSDPISEYLRLDMTINKICQPIDCNYQLYIYNIVYNIYNNQL